MKTLTGIFILINCLTNETNAQNVSSVSPNEPASIAQENPARTLNTWAMFERRLGV